MHLFSLLKSPKITSAKEVMFYPVIVSLLASLRNFYQRSTFRRESPH